MSDTHPTELPRETPPVARAVPALAGVAVSVVPMLLLMAAYLAFHGPIDDFMRMAFAVARHDRIGLPITVLLFVVTAYLGAPQIVLISACVLAFGPMDGFLYSWFATIVSGAVTYQHGRLAGASAFARFAGPGGFTNYLGKNGFLASLLVRFIPGPPFIVVNAGLGAANVGFWAFLAGLALGVLPKTALVAFAGNGVFNALEGDIATALAMGGLAIALFVFGALFLKRIAARRVAAAKDAPPSP